jgi:hypothetical protein
MEGQVVLKVSGLEQPVAVRVKWQPQPETKPAGRGGAANRGGP